MEEIGAAYDARDPEALARFRAAGALVWTAHTEQQTVEHTRLVDGLEIYNLHANVAPDIRTEDLGLGPLDIAQILRFSEARHRLEPDLAVLAFLSAVGGWLGPPAALNPFPVDAADSNSLANFLAPSLVNVPHEVEPGIAMDSAISD